MAVQILNNMPDAEVSRGDPVAGLLHSLRLSRQAWHFSGRAAFMAATIALHVIAALAFMSMRNDGRTKNEPDPIMATLLDAPASEAEVPPEYTPPPVNLVYSLPMPQDLAFESDAITPPPVMVDATAPSAQTFTPPMVEAVEYVRAPAPVYPSESNRKRERGTVLLRVLIDTVGRPAEIQIERSSGYARLDSAAREAVEKARFRPHEVNGIAQPAQVLIPIEFIRRAT